MAKNKTDQPTDSIVSDFQQYLDQFEQHLALREVSLALSSLITARTFASAGTNADAILTEAFARAGLVAAEDGHFDAVRMVAQQLTSLIAYEQAEALARFLLEIEPYAIANLKLLFSVLSLSGREGEAISTLEHVVSELASQPEIGYQLLPLLANAQCFELALTVIDYATLCVAQDLTPFISLLEAIKARPDGEAVLQLWISHFHAQPLIVAYLKRYVSQSVQRPHNFVYPSVKQSSSNGLGVRVSPSPYLYPFDKQRIFFHHMVGTGGNTFAVALADSMGKARLVQLSAQSNGYQRGDAAPLSATGPSVFYGHNLLGLPERSGISGNYATLLRNPYDRLISDFFWLCCLDKTMTAQEAMSKFFRLVESSEHLEFYIHHCGPLNYENQQHFDLAECTKISNPDADLVARANLDSKFWLVGITELFDESLYLAAMHTECNTVSAWWGKRHPYTRFRPAFMDLPKRIRTMIEDKTAFDMALYEDYRALFEARFAEEAQSQTFVDYFNNAHPCV